MTNNFHKHLNECKQCKNHPFNLCPTGKRIFENKHSHISNIFNDVFKINPTRLNKGNQK